MKAPQDILDGISADNCEAVYQAFYPACQAGGFDGALLVAQINEVFHAHRDPVLRSYCFLLLSAVVDSGTLSKEACQETADFLVQELRALTDFSLKDDQGRYIHYLSHMGYLAGSLRGRTDMGDLYEALLNAYLRSDVQVCGHEDVVLGEVLLDAPNLADFLGRLKGQAPQGASMARFHAEANKRALWLAMYGLNTRLKRQDPAVFAPLLGDLAAIVQD
ncbi:MAG: hypothetical protein V3V13_07340 [Paracoccaceae bacterium]